MDTTSWAEPDFRYLRREIGIHSNTQICTRSHKSGGTNQIAVSASGHMFTPTRSTLPPTSCQWHALGRAESHMERILLSGGLLGSPSMKQEQVYVAREFLEGKEVFAVLPTGFGKSLHVLCMPTCSTRYLEESLLFKSVGILLYSCYHPFDSHNGQTR